jgi:hypothetical protein
MSIAQRLADYEPPRIGSVCKTCTLLKELPEGESAALQKALDDPTISNAGLMRILRAEGFPLAETTLRRHRVGECKK